MDLLTKYSDTIIKEIMQTIARSQRKLDKARTREMKLHQEGPERNSNYWKNQRSIEVEFGHIDKLYEELDQMDAETQWTSKLHQERFSFIHQKYSGVYEEFQFRYERVEGADE